MANKIDLAAREMDLAARSIDLLTILAKVAQSTETTQFIMKEVGRWLGREGLDENELQFYLESAHGLVKPNQQSELRSFYDAITDRKPKPSVVPLWAQPSGALGRLVARDPQQRWITSTISCLFRYHNESFVKDVICALIMQTRFSHRSGKALSEYQLAWHPDTLRLGQILNKIVASNWLHIANSGLIGSKNESPKLPEELNFACALGHNIESHRLGLVLSKLRDPPPEVIFQSDHLLTNLVLWLLWHFSGRLRVVVSGKILYDKSLGEERCTIEFRVAKYCPTDEPCTASKTVPTFQMLVNVAGNLRKLLGGKYDSQQTLMSQPRVRRKLYHSPFQHPKSSHNSIKILTLRTAQEIMRWLLDRPVSREAFGSRLTFNISLEQRDPRSKRGLRVADLLGRTPALLNMRCGDLGRTFIVYSKPPEQTPPTVDNFLENLEEEDEEEEDFNPEEDRVESLLPYFPILQDLLDDVAQSCRCPNCYRGGPYSKFRFDAGCLQYQSFMEVMFYLADGIADAFGAPDASANSGSESDGFGVVRVLLEVIEGIRFHYQHEGTVQWHTFLSAAVEVFLGCPALDKLTEATEIDGSIGVKANFMQHLASTVVAVQYGDLAVVAPWLDISRPISIRGCFRFSVAEGQLGLVSDELSERPTVQEVAKDIAVIESQHTEDVRDYIERYQKQSEAVGTEIAVSDDNSDVHCDYVLVSVDGTRYRLLMRVSSISHSRMVDPSMAILKISHGLLTLKCEHKPNRNAAVPMNQLVELYSFDELLGRWANTSGREIDTSEDTSSETSDEEHSPHPFIAAQQRLPATQAGARTDPCSDPSTLVAIRVSHVLNSSFKYNVAVALTGDDPVFTNSETACMACTLKQAVSFEAEHGLQKHGRWIIHKVKDPVSTRPKPKLAIRSSQRRSMISENLTAGNADKGGMAMEIDEDL